MKHAGARVEAHERKRLEQLCRTITRPALSDERVQLITAGQVELKLKTPWRDGTLHLVMSPLELMQPGPPKDEQAPGVAASGLQCEAETAQVGPARISWARLLKRVLATT